MISTRRGTRASLGAVVTAIAVAFALSLLWNLPVSPDGFGWARLGVLSLEIVAAFAVIALASPLRQGRAAVSAALLIAAATMLVVVLKLADLTMQQVLGRPLNPVLDVRLVRALTDLLTDVLGGPLGWAACAALAVAPLVVCVLAYGGVRRAQTALSDPIARAATLAVCALLVAWFALGAASGAGSPAVSTEASTTMLRYARAARETARGIAEVRAVLAEDRFEGLPASRMLAGLRGADVLLVFFESYGRSALELPRYTGTIAPALDDFEARLAARGLASASGWLTSPTVGGQSWLASGTFTSGLWLTDQGRYDVAMQSARLTLVRAFARAGYRTVALKPAITRPWPEGDTLGFARVYAAADLGYAGKPYNWITMPDQYTLSVLQRAERTAPASPLFAEVSLISSHTPWTPIAGVLEDWSTIGDGRVFSRWADEGDPPDVVWSDVELMRVQYGRSVDYVLRVLASYADNFVDEGALLILVGDHQPPPLITGDDAGQDVPIHVISGDPALLEPFTAWGFNPGMRPSADLPPKRMDAFRDFLLEAFSTAEQRVE